VVLRCATSDRQMRMSANRALPNSAMGVVSRLS